MSSWSRPSASTTPSSGTRSCRTWRPARASSSSMRPTASRTGATISGRTTGASAPCSQACPPSPPSWRRRPPPTSASPPMWPSSWRGARWAGPPPRCSSCAGASSGIPSTWAWRAWRTLPPGWPGSRPTSSAPRAPGSSTASPSPPRARPRRPCAPPDWRWPPTPARPSPPSASASRPISRPTASRRSWPPAPWAWASTSPTSASSSTWARRPPPWRTTSRWGARGAASRGRRWSCCPGRRIARSGTGSAPRASHRPSGSARCSTPWRRPTAPWRPARWRP